MFLKRLYDSYSLFVVYIKQKEKQDMMHRCLFHRRCLSLLHCFNIFETNTKHKFMLFA